MVQYAAKGEPQLSAVVGLSESVTLTFSLSGDFSAELGLPFFFLD